MHWKRAIQRAKESILSTWMLKIITQWTIILRKETLFSKRSKSNPKTLKPQPVKNWNCSIYIMESSLTLLPLWTTKQNSWPFLTLNVSFCPSKQKSQVIFSVQALPLKRTKKPGINQLSTGQPSKGWTVSYPFFLSPLSIHIY